MSEKINIILNPKKTLLTYELASIIPILVRFADVEAIFKNVPQGSERHFKLK